MTETTRPTEIIEADLDGIQGGGEGEYRYVPVRRFFPSTSTAGNTGDSTPVASPDGYTATDDLWE